MNWRWRPFATSDRCWTPACAGEAYMPDVDQALEYRRLYNAAAKLIAAIAVSHTPGIARLPVAEISAVTTNGVKPPIAVARL